MMRTTVNISDMSDVKLLVRYKYLNLCLYGKTAEMRAEMAAIEYEILRRMSQSNVSGKEAVDTA